MKTKTIITTICCCILFFALKTTAQELPPQPVKPLRIKEFGIGFTDLKSFSMQYRWGSERLLYRLSGSISGNTSFGKSNSQAVSFTDTLDHYNVGSAKNVVPVNISAGLNFSILKLKPVSEKFGFLYGLTVGMSYGYMNSRSTNTTTNDYEYPGSSVGSVPLVTQTTTTTYHNIQPSIGIALGGYYKITPAFWLYAEINPNIYYSFDRIKNVTTQNYTAYGYTTHRTNPDQHNNQFGVSNLSNSLASLTLVYRFGQ